MAGTHDESSMLEANVYPVRLSVVVLHSAMNSQASFIPHFDSTMNSDSTMTVNRGLWSEDEHNRFLEAIQSYPHGPWRYVAEHVGTRNIRQVQTHAQKYYEKISRHLRGLRKERNLVLRAEHRIDTLPVGLHRPMITQELESRAARLGVDGDDVKIEPDNGDVSDSDDGGRSPSYTAAEVPSLEDSLDILLEWLEEE